MYEAIKPKQKRKKALTFENIILFLKGRQKVLNGFESKMFSIRKQTQGKGIKILTPKQMLQRLPIVLAQVKARNTSENLVNKICQIIFFILSKRKN